MRLKCAPLVKALFLALNLGCAEAFANPTEGEVIAGTATISTNQQNPNNLIIDQSSQKAIINWQTFNVNKNEAVQFETPNANSITLNRVLSPAASQILGDINSNGQVWIINQNGIVFGNNAEVNVAGLTASTLDIQNNAFMQGNYQFTQNNNKAAQIINQGHLTADNGYVALLAPEINNSGIVQAQLGTVAMGATTEATLTFSGNNNLSIGIPQNTTAVPMYDDQGNVVTSATLNNSGTIRADGGRVLLTAASVDTLLDESINVSGVIEADTAQNVNGNIVLISSQQTILQDATISAQGTQAGQIGGNVEVIGQDVGLFGNTSINASGAAGGGDIHVGRDDQDHNAFEAQETIIDPSVTLNATATQSGNGGFIETSGDVLQENSSNISAAGANGGAAGSWLLDPYNLMIANNSGANENVDSSGSPIDEFAAAGDPSILDTSVLQTALVNSNITVTTGTSGSDTGNITVATSITSTSSHNLTLEAAGSITVDSGATISVGKSLTLDVGASGTGNIDIEGTLESGTAVGSALTLNAYNYGSLDTTGTITLGSAGQIITGNTSGLSTMVAGAGITLAAGSTITALGTGTVSISADEYTSNTAGLNDLGTITAAHNVQLTDASTAFSSEDVAINLGGNINSSNGSISVTGTTGAISQSSGNLVAAIETALIDGDSIDLPDSGNSFGSINATTINSGSTITLVDGNGNGVELEGGTSNANLSLTAAGEITLFGDVTLGTGTLNLTSTGSGINQTTGTITVGNTVLESTGSVVLSQTGGGYGTISTTGSGVAGLSVTETDATPIELGAITDTGDLTISTGADITQAGAITMGGTAGAYSASFNTTGAGAADLDNVNNDFNQDTVNVGNTGSFTSITLNDSDAIALNLGAIDSDGALTIATLGTNESIVLNADIYGGSGDTVSLTAAGSGSITGDDTAIVNGGQPIGTVDLTSSSGAMDLYVDTPDLTFNTTGDVTVTNTNIGGLTLTGNSTGSNITLEGQGIKTTAPTSGASIAATGNLTLNTTQFGGEIILGGNIQSATVNLNSPNAILTTGGSITATGGGTIDAGVGNIGSSGTALTGNFGDASVTLDGDNIYLTDTNTTGLKLGDINSSGNVTLHAAGGISQTEALSITGTTSLTAADDITLTHTSNNFTGSMTATGDNVSLADARTLTLNEVTASGNVTLAAEQLDNVGGSDAITTGTGDAWQIYVTNLSGNTFDGLASGHQAIWGTSYGTSISESGNRYIFATAEDLTLSPEATPFDVTKTQGEEAVLPTPTAGTNYQVNGFVNAADYDNVFTQDTISNTAISGLSFTSTGAPKSAAVGNYPVSMTGTAATNTGYSVEYNNTAEFGELTVNAPPTPPTPPAPSVPNYVNPSVVTDNVQQTSATKKHIKNKGFVLQNSALSMLQGHDDCEIDNDILACYFILPADTSVHQWLNQGHPIATILTEQQLHEFMASVASQVQQAALAHEISFAVNLRTNFMSLPQVAPVVSQFD